MAKSTSVKRKSKSLKNRPNSERNNRPYDIWSLVHFVTGIFFGWIMPPFIAIAIMIAWEPLEILVLSPILANFNIDFGFETAKNSFSDMIVDVLGVAVGYYGLLWLSSPPIRLF